MLVIVGLLGAFSMPVYSLALAHANDNTKDDFLLLGTAVLFLNSLGSVIGPMAASESMGWQAARGLFGYCALCLGLGALYGLFMLLRRPALRLHFEHFQPLARTTQGAIESDPRAPHATDSGT
jgi:MFS family permease